MQLLHPKYSTKEEQSAFLSLFFTLLLFRITLHNLGFNNAAACPVALLLHLRKSYAIDSLVVRSAG
eukprot:JP436617.1.p3 GENE.JP436617.1~~JP436617.1.p3  ORF type:complete len:66 (-),score=1.96 JP436617.1:106-303(-)